MKQQNLPKTSHRTAKDAIRVEVAMRIPAPPQAVFAYLSDLENNPEWNWAVITTHALDDRRGKGARYLQKRSRPRPRREILEVTAYESPRLLEVLAGEAEEGSVRYRYRLSRRGIACTNLQVSVELKPGSTSIREMYAARLGAAIASNLEDLRAVIGGTQDPVSIALPR